MCVALFNYGKVVTFRVYSNSETPTSDYRKKRRKNVMFVITHLNHFLFVLKGIEWSFSHQDSMLLWRTSQFIEERMPPDFLHVVPVRYNTMFNWIFYGEDTSSGLSL